MPTALPPAEPTDLIPPSSVLSVFETAIPESVLTNPSALQSLIAQGTTASWYQALPADAKSWISHVDQELVTMTGMPSSGEYATTTGESSGEYGSTSMAGSMTAMSSGGSASASGAATSSSAGGASMPTGPVAAGVAGVAGIIGLAVAL